LVVVLVFIMVVGLDMLVGVFLVGVVLLYV